MRLLVIEDNRSLVANLFDYFEARGYTLDAAPDGVTGLHLASTQVYDAIVLDWMLPRLEGPEVLRRLRDEHASAVPVIMLTGQDSELEAIQRIITGQQAMTIALAPTKRVTTAGALPPCACTAACPLDPPPALR